MSPSTPAAFDPVAALAALSRAGVEYVVVGQAAVILRGFPGTTVDLDIAPRHDIDNAERLVAALDALHARHAPLHDDDAPGPPPDERDFLGWSQVRRYVTDAGPVDVVPRPIGVGDYTDLARDGDVVDVAGHHVVVASLDDVIASKEAAGRPKDRAALPGLRRLRDRLRRGR